MPMEKTREEFIVFIRQALNDRTSDAYEELYQFLVSCYVRADTAMSGQVKMDKFDTLIEEAAALPRLYGYAPKTGDLYKTDSARTAARTKMFKEMDPKSNGYVTLDNWVSFAVEHIARKVSGLPKDILGGTSKDVSKDEFIAFVRKAVDKSSPEYRELYFFLVKTFKKGDKERTGQVGPVAFDAMIEDAAEAPRRFGLAPSSADMFPTAQARLARRKEYFATMDTDNNGTISLDEWINYAYKHIVSKVAGL